MALFNRKKNSHVQGNRRREPVFSARLPEPNTERSPFTASDLDGFEKPRVRQDAYPPRPHLTHRDEQDHHTNYDAHEAHFAHDDHDVLENEVRHDHDDAYAFEDDAHHASDIENFEQPRFEHHRQPRQLQPRIVGQTTIGALQLIRNTRDVDSEFAENEYLQQRA